VITPGPSSIDPDTAPGGLVVHAYRVPDGVLVFTQRLMGDYVESVPEYVETIACANADTAVADAPCGVVLVFYDGDSGERGWTQPALFV
jgi:hypothetical protein